MATTEHMPLVLHEVLPPETSIFDDSREKLYDAPSGSQQQIGRRFSEWRKSIIFGIVIAVFFIVSISLVISYARKSDISNEPAAVTQVEKVIGGDIACSKSSGRITCTCSGGLVWNGTHCNERVDGGWCKWYSISHCNVSCGYGHQEMMRHCSCPWPRNGGSPCRGPVKTFHLCSQQNCSTVKENDKVDGKWCQWLPLSLCNVSCGHGHQQMIRYCECPAPENGGNYCIGKNQTTLPCFQSNCTTNTINGGWCKWRKASPCSASCGAGTHEMVRYCSCPAPGNGGDSCIGQNRTVVSCLGSNCANTTANETCDFEFGLNKEKCFWTQDKLDDFDWKREYSRLVRSDVRPVADHTLRNQYGHYMHIQYNEQKYMDKARLLSRLRGATNATCLQFWYDIQGSSAGTLNIYIMDDNGKKLIWTTSGDQKNRWQYGFVQFGSPTVYMLAIEGTVGRDSKGSSNGDIAIDDVSIVDTPCPLPETIRCNHTLKGNSGKFSSPFYPEYYPDNVLCFYHIEASLGYSIHIQLNSLNLQSSQSCRNDSLKIYEKGLLKMTYCGNYAYVEEYKSIGNTLLLVFQSDGSGTGLGFNGQYTANETPCQFNLTSESGEFSFPLPLYTWKKCTFRIEVPEGKFINIKYNGSSYPTSKASCYVSNFITIYEGGIGSQYSMRRICNNGSGVYRSYSNTTYIQVASTQFLISATYTAVNTAEDCNYNVTQVFNRFASPGYPHSYPNNVICNYFFEVAKDSAIRVQFTYMSLATNPLCGDMITFYDFSNGMEKKLCENQNGVVWTSRGNKGRLTFKSDSSIISKGFSGYLFKIVRPCNYTFTSPTGNFTSPGYPNKFPRGVTCEFQIKAPYGKSVKIDFDRTLYRFWRYCEGYVTIYEDVIDERTAKAKFCGQGPKSYQSFSNNVYVVFISKPSAIPYKGFYANYSVVDQVCNYTLEAPAFNFTSPGYPNAYPNNVLCQYRFKIALGQAVRIYFADFSLENSASCTKDSVKMYENGNLSTTFCGLKSFSNPWTSVGDSVVMIFKADQSYASKGFYGYFSFFTYPCDKYFTSPSGNFSSPGYPGAYPRGKNCWYHITVANGKSVKIDFRVISLRANSICYDEFIKIYEDTTTTEDTVKARYCGRGSRTFYSYSSVIHIVFKPKYYDSQLPIFFANYSEIDKACIYTVSTAHRYATSPGYPNNYFNNLNCRYSFEFPKNQIVEVDFSTFSVQSSESCANDSVKLYEKDTLRATYCGRSAKKWISTVNRVTIVFQTDASVTSKGFYAYVTWKDKVYENFLTAPAGNFSSPDFPGPYPLGGKSIYHITVDKSKSIKIDFPIFDMRCAMEKVYIYEDEATAYKQRAILCGTGPKSFTSYSNKVIISFQANKITAMEGFFGIYSEVDKVCDYVLTPPMTVFSSPGYKYQTKYANNSYCRYRFKVPGGKTMKISFDYMSLQPSESCSKDSVKIYENAVLKGTYCGYRRYGISLSLHESEAVMIFQSDSSNSSYGFYGSYTVLDQLCRYTFTSPSGNFKSPGIPCKFARGTECQYHITVGKGKGIKIDFPVVQLLQSELCTDEYVSIYEGSIQYETRKATFCGNGSRTFLSFTNKIYVVFHSSLLHKSSHGFHANYTETERACKYNLKAPSFTFSSPGYPSNYPNISDCQYHFKVADDRSIRLSFNFISLQSSPSCKEASIKIYESGSLKETICGASPATKTWLSIGNEVFMTFQANSSTSSKGFYGSFSPVIRPCYYSYTSENGNFSSIGYPNKYQDRARCDYDIKVRQGSTIKLDFQSFDLEYSLACRYDYLKIYNVFPSGIKIAATFCGTGARTFVSNSSQILIEFRSDEAVTGKCMYSITYGCNSSMMQEASFSADENPKDTTDQNSGEDEQCHENPASLPGQADVGKLNIVEVKCSKKFRQGLFVLVALLLVVIIPIIIWYSIKAGQTNAIPQVEKVTSGKVSCSKSNGRIECICNDGLVWNGTHCNDKVNGSWCEWFPVSPCSVSCGHGHQEFIRYCDCPAPENGGAYCSGKNHISYSCLLHNCTKTKEPEIVNGGWCEWHFASPCNVSCGNGYQEMVHYCSCPSPKNGGSQCSGSAVAFHPCNQRNCSKFDSKNKVNGSWCEWLPVSPCSVSCGNGHQEFVRYCDCPAPENGGAYCSGSSKTTHTCSLEVCKNKTESEVCNFEYGLDKEACYWTQDQADDFDWTLSLWSYVGVGTGPSSDHTFRARKGGHFLFIKSEKQKYLDTARLLSRLQSPTSGSCFSFWYNMNGKGVGQLSIYRIGINSESHLMWNKSGDHKNRWNLGAIYFNTTAPYQLAIVGVVGKDSDGSTTYGNIAIDDLVISSGVCSTPGPVQCNHTYNATAGTSTFFSSPFYPEYYPDNLKCYYQFETRPGYVLKFSFNNLRLQNSSSCAKDSLKVYENGALQKAYCGNYPMTVNLLSSGSKVLLALRSDESISDLGFSGYFESIIKPCKFTFKKSSGNFTFPLYPNGKTCQYNIMVGRGNLITVNFPFFSLRQSYHCNSERIDIYENSISYNNRKAQLCGSGPKTYTSESNVLRIVYTSSEVPSKQTFLGQYYLTEKPCIYNVTQSANHFTSPNYPAKYPNNIYCKYYFKVPKNNIIKISITSMDLEQSPSCAKDSIALYEGTTILQDRICGSRSSLSRTSKGSEVLLIFQADGTTSSSGFTGYLSATKKPCKYVFSSPTGTFRSPQDPDYLQGQCNYEISVANGMSIKIDFPIFSLPTDDECSSSVYVKIYEKVIDYRTIKKVLSGSGPKTFQSYGNKVFIQFVSSLICPRTQGFVANYSATNQVCRYYIDTSPYKFTTPGYPSNYPNNAFCEYHIKAPQDKAVRIHFRSFSLQTSSGCQNDSLKIYERGLLKTTLCGKKSSSVWSSVDSEVLLIFQSDSSSSSSGIYGYYELIEKPCDVSINAVSGNFTSPGYPGAFPRSRTCTYHITVAEGKSVRIDFKSYSLRQSGTCSEEYIAVYEDIISKDTLHSQFCGNGSRTYYSFSNKVHIVFKPVYYTTLPLFYANFSEVNRDCTFVVTPPFDRILSPGYPNSYPNNLTCRYYFKYLSDKKLTINFKTFQLQSSPLCENDSVTFYENGVLKATHCGTNFRWYTAVRHDVLMIFRADAASSFKGFYGQLLLREKDTTSCHYKMFSAPSGHFTSPHFPAKYTKGKECRYHIIVEKGKSMIIDFTVMGLSCIDESVIIYEDDDEATLMKSKFCGFGPRSFRSVSNSVYVRFKPTVYYLPRNGFSAYYRTVDRECSYILTPPSLQFSSPTVSPNTSYCRYLFKVPDSKTIMISFDYMALLPSPSCSMESIKIYENGEIKATFCRTAWYRKWTSSESEVLLVFQSNSSLTSQKFRGSFKVVDKSCGYTFTSPSGSFRSPEIPCEFARGTECRYHITVGKGKGIKIDFPVVHLLQSELCTDEYISIYEGSIRFETKKSTFCGNGSRTFQSFSNMIHVLFHSSLSHKAFHGFHANYTETQRACNYSLTLLSSIFSSPGYPDGFPSNSSCEYHIKPPQGNNVVLFFKQLSLQSTPSCRSASIKLYENNTLNETFCGEKPFTRTWYSSIGSRIRLVFQANASGTTNGFYGFYAIALNNAFNQSYTSENGSFSSVGYPYNYQSNLKCDYNIKVKQGNVIKLDFQSFDLEYSLACRYDYLKIYNVFPSSINLAATFCGTGARTFVSNSSQILIKFRSDDEIVGNGFYASYSSIIRN